MDLELLRDKENPVDQFNYGYALTCHKSQGSQWGNVLVVNEPFKGFEPNEHGYHKEWLYTAITRAGNTLILGMSLRHNVHPRCLFFCADIVFPYAPQIT